MRAHLGQKNYHALVFILVSPLLLQSACSTRTQPQITNATPAPETNPGPEGTLPDTGYEDLFSTPRRPLPDEELPARRPSTDRSPREEACLSNDDELLSEEGAGPNSGYNVRAVLNSPGYRTLGAGACIERRPPSSSFSHIDREALLTEALGSFQMMGNCFERIANLGPETSDEDPELVTERFVLAKLALVRCYRSILKRTMERIPWSQPQQQVAEDSDYNFLMMMGLMGSGG